MTERNKGPALVYYYLTNYVWKSSGHHIRIGHGPGSGKFIVFLHFYIVLIDWSMTNYMVFLFYGYDINHFNQQNSHIIGLRSNYKTWFFTFQQIYCFCKYF